MDATLLIYSGRPNPRWRIDGDEARAIQAMIAELPRSPGGGSVPDGLGYAGIDLAFVDPAGRRRQAHFFGGSASIDGGAYKDPGRRVERRLLEGAGELGLNLTRMF